MRDGEHYRRSALRADRSLLRRFWREIEGASREERFAALLRAARAVRWAREGELERREQWRRHARANFKRSRQREAEIATPGPCWCCEAERRRVRHHVVQLQHGGSNDPRNIVAICDACHAQLHPHLPVAPGTDEAFYRRARRLIEPVFDDTPRLVKRTG